MNHRQTILPLVSFVNEGAGLIAAGDFGAAIRSLKNALKTSRHIHVDFLEVQCNGRPFRPSIPWRSNVNLDIDMDVPTNDDDQNDQGNSTSVFRRPIRIIIRSDHCSDGDKDATSLDANESNIRVLSAAIIFNMALSFHLSALTPTSGTGRNSNATLEGVRLRKAVQLYERAYEVQSISSESVLPSVHLAFRMALLNNLAQAHAWLGNETLSEQCSQQLLSTLLFVVGSTGPQGGLDRFPLCNRISSLLVDCCLRSTCHFIFKSKSQPAAAA